MSLIKEQTMTEKSFSAHRQNARQSQGAVTPEGKERARAANLRHGGYSQIRDEALAALGENPAELAALLAGAQPSASAAGRQHGGGAVARINKQGLRFGQFDLTLGVF
jgi:hypothetical protein